MLDPETIPKLLAAGTIEVAPLAYMRGRTLNDAFIILDEAQNTSPEQMKMFLTRLGFGSKMVVTGDVTQVDLPDGHQSGLRVVEEHPRRRQGHVVQPPHRARRRTSPAGRPHRGGVRRVRRAATRDARPPRRRAATGRRPRRRRRPMSIEVLDESGAEVDVKRTRRSSCRFVHGPDADAPAGRAVHQARRRGHHRRAQRAVDGQGGPDRRAGLPDGRAAPGPGQRGARGGRARRPRALPAGRRAAGDRDRRATRTDRRDRPADACTASCTSLGYDHAEPDEHAEMFGLQARLLAEWQGVTRRPAE